MNNVVIIPARGRSKRLPGKNLIALNGMPLIAHSIKYAISNQSIVQEVYVSTDDKDIKKIALQEGAKVIDRPDQLADDYTSTVAVLKHAAETLKTVPDTIILLQPTNPLRPKTLLSEAYKTYIDGKYESLMTVSTHRKKLGKIVEGSFSPYNYTMGQRSQDMDPLYFENGLLYITSTDLILKHQILGKYNCPYIVDHPYSKVDIDTIEDLKYAQFVSEHY